MISTWNRCSKFAEGRKDNQITQSDLEDWNGYGIPVLRTEDGKDVKGFEVILDFARVLHGHLLTMTEGGGEANTIVGNTADKNGLEAWRRLGARFYPISEAGATGLAIEIKSIPKAQSAIEVPGKIEILDKLCAEYMRIRGVPYDDVEYKVAVLGLLDSDTHRDVTNAIDPEDVKIPALKAEARKRARLNATRKKLSIGAVSAEGGDGGGEHQHDQESGCPADAGHQGYDVDSMHKGGGKGGGKHNPNIQCFHCQGFGHPRSKCPHLKGKGKGKSDQPWYALQYGKGGQYGGGGGWKGQQYGGGKNGGKAP